MQALTNTISSTPNWSLVVPCKDYQGNEITSDIDISDGNKTYIKAGQVVYTQTLADSVSDACKQPVAYAMRSAQDDVNLQNQIWSVKHGTAAIHSQQNQGAETVSQAIGDTPQYNWVVDQPTSHHGLAVNQKSIQIDAKDNFSINCSNSYLRTLYAYYEVDTGTPSPQAIQSVSSVNTILGIPMPTDPTTLTFNMAGADKIELLFGSLGTSDWEEDVSLDGALLTGLWQYGVPTVMIAASAGITSTKTFNKIVNDPQLTAAALGVALPIVGGGVATAAALINFKSIMTTFADAIAGILLQKGLEALSKWILKQVAAGELAAAFGPVGWAFKLTAVALDFEEMAVATGEVLSSPATIKVNISRSISVTLTLTPDPKHGEAGHPDTAVWPALADHYEVTLEYKDGGTPKVISGTMLSETNNIPINLNFAQVLAGHNAEFRITAGIYSSSGWLCGKWQSDWIPAVPNDGTTLNLGSFSITEILVPLTQDTQYQFKEKIVYQITNGTGDYVWEASSNPPTTTSTSLDCGPNRTLCQLTGMTINNSAFQVGYCWRSSGQNLPLDGVNNPPSAGQEYVLQNLSVLSDPGSRLKVSQIGFSEQPSIAYAPASASNPNDINQTNFILDPRNGQMHLRQVKLDDGSNNFGFAQSQ